MFTSLWQRITNWLRRKRSKPVLTVREVAPEPPETPPAPAPVEPQDDLAALRFYEKRRRKHDRFVTPKGELPKREPKPRPTTQEVKPRTPKPADVEPVPAPLPNGNGIGLHLVEPHHDDGEKVLFKVEEMLGEFNFRDTILQQLERYFFYLRRMKKLDREAYGFYRQIGATLLPYISTGAHDRGSTAQREPRPHLPLPAWFNELRPSFGCFAYGADPETEKFEQTSVPGHSKKWENWVPKFMYFTKYSLPPIEVQPMTGGDIYMLTIWWDRPSKKIKHGIPQQMPIFVSKDGQTIKALKTLKTEYRTVRSLHGKFSVPSRAWQIPKDYREWAKQFEEDAEHFLVGLFLDAINQSTNSHLSMIRVEVTQADMAAVFSVNIARTAYFFQDRDIEVTQNGTRKRIFHVVAPHVRSNGTAVKMHFRGVRDFTWAGYHVHISVPGLDHRDINEIDIGMVDEERLDKKERKGSMVYEELGTKLAGHIHTGRWST